MRDFGVGGSHRPWTCRHYASGDGFLFDLDQTENAAEAGSAPQQLALDALSTINQDAVAARFDEEAGMVALCRRNACRRP